MESKPRKSTARLNPRHQEMVRTKIQASQIINRLTDCVMGKTDLTSEQVAAARILLGKSVPDLQRTELTGKDGGPMTLVQALPGDQNL
jgi:hypothetical protein